MSQQLAKKIKQYFKTFKNKENILSTQNLVKQIRDNNMQTSFKATSKAYNAAVSEWLTRIESFVCNNPNTAKFYGYTNNKFKSDSFIFPLCSV